MMEGKIYRISIGDYFYYGSTKHTLKRRLSSHKSKSKTEISKLYTKIRELGWDCVKMELIEEYSCETKLQLREREDFFIKPYLQNSLCLNEKSAVFNEEYQKQWVENNKELVENQQKQYRENHREYYREYQRTRRTLKKSQVQAHVPLPLVCETVIDSHVCQQELPQHI